MIGGRNAHIASGTDVPETLRFSQSSPVLALQSSFDNASLGSYIGAEVGPLIVIPEDLDRKSFHGTVETKVKDSKMLA
jgi:hypothetical protein